MKSDPVNKEQQEQVFSTMCTTNQDPKVTLVQALPSLSKA